MGRAKGIVLSYVYTIMNACIGLILSALIVRSFGQANYGVYQASTAFASYLVLFELGTSSIINRNISMLRKNGSDQRAIDANISTIWTMTLMLSVIIVFVSSICYCFFGEIYKNSMSLDQISLAKQIYVLAVMRLVFGFYVQTLSGAMIGFERYSLTRIATIIQLLARMVIVTVCILSGCGILSIVIIDLILESAIFVFLFVYCRFKVRMKLTVSHFDRAVFISVFPLAAALLFQGIINMANSSVDKFVISLLMGPEDVAVYSVAMYIYMTFSTIVSIPISMYMPEVAKNMSSGMEGAELTASLVQPCRLVVLVGGVIVGGFFAVGRQFFTFVYGEGYAEAWRISIIIMIPMLVSMTNGVIINILDILNKRIVRSTILLGVGAINISLTIWWIHIWGMTGAAMATAVSAILGLIASNIYYTKKIGIRIIYLFSRSYRGILPCLVIATIMGSLVARLCTSHLLSLFLGGSVFLMVFFALFWMFGANDTEKSLMSKYVKLKRKNT